MRKNSGNNEIEGEKRCLFKIIPQNFIHNKVDIITMQGGKNMIEKTVIFHGVQGKGEIRPSAFNLVKKDENNYEAEDKFENLKKILT